MRRSYILPWAKVPFLSLTSVVRRISEIDCWYDGPVCFGIFTLFYFWFNFRTEDIFTEARCSWDIHLGRAQKIFGQGNQSNASTPMTTSAWRQQKFCQKQFFTLFRLVDFRTGLIIVAWNAHVIIWPWLMRLCWLCFWICLFGRYCFIY